ncbi:MAG: DUF3570 domain-containing protein [Candidatus Eiseniibacteriota bacterium]
MQLTRARIGLVATLACAGAGLSLAAPATTWAAIEMLEDQAADALMQYFTDSDKVSVRSLIGSCSVALRSNTTMSFQWNNEHVTIPAIDAPAGSPEAVDAITTASRPIAGNAYSDFNKVRNEITAGAVRGGTSVSYYISSETDYLGQQLAASHNKSFMDEKWNASVGGSYGWDRIEPVADDDTNTGADTKTTLHWNVVGTRVVSPTMLLRMGVEYNLVSGLQHNPYRNVYAGGTNVPERHPDHRSRSDVFVRFNKYMNNRSSAKLSYRLYGDDWGIISHEVGARLSQYVRRGLFASYEYRWYTQSAADFYRPEYETTSGVDGYLSGDYRMAELASHLFGFGLNFDLDAFTDGGGWTSPMALKFNYERYFNSNNYTASFLTTQLTYRF